VLPLWSVHNAVGSFAEAVKEFVPIVELLFVLDVVSKDGGVENHIVENVGEG